MTINQLVALCFPAGERKGVGGVGRIACGQRTVMDAQGPEFGLQNSYKRQGIVGRFL